MATFKNFIYEIAVDQELAPPESIQSVPRKKSSMVHSEGDPSHGIIPLVAHRSLLDRIEDLGSTGRGYRPAMEALSRLAAQPADGGLLMVNISNVEADSLRSLAISLISDSNKVMSSKMGSSMKDEAMRWSAWAEGILRSLENGLRIATSGGR